MKQTKELTVTNALEAYAGLDLVPEAKARELLGAAKPCMAKPVGDNVYYVAVKGVRNVFAMPNSATGVLIVVGDDQVIFSGEAEVVDRFAGAMDCGVSGTVSRKGELVSSFWAIEYDSESAEKATKTLKALFKKGDSSEPVKKTKQPVVAEPDDADADDDLTGDTSFDALLAELTGKPVKKVIAQPEEPDDADADDGDADDGDDYLTGDFTLDGLFSSDTTDDDGEESDGEEGDEFGDGDDDGDDDDGDDDDNTLHHPVYRRGVISRVKDESSSNNAKKDKSSSFGSRFLGGFGRAKRAVGNAFGLEGGDGDSEDEDYFDEEDD